MASAQYSAQDGAPVMTTIFQGAGVEIEPFDQAFRDFRGDRRVFIASGASAGDTGPAHLDHAVGSTSHGPGPFDRMCQPINAQLA
jgi:hypothetical protein